MTPSLTSVKRPRRVAGKNPPRRCRRNQSTIRSVRISPAEWMPGQSRQYQHLFWEQRCRCSCLRLASRKELAVGEERLAVELERWAAARPPEAEARWGRPAARAARPARVSIIRAAARCPVRRIPICLEIQEVARRILPPA